MLIHESASKTARTGSVVMSVAFVFLGALGPLLTMHFYVKPSPSTQKPLRIFGWTPGGKQKTFLSSGDSN